MNAIVRKLRPSQNREPELVPSLESVSPEYAKQRELRDALQHRLHALVAERDRIGTENYAPQLKHSQDVARTRRVLSLLGRTPSPEHEQPTASERMTEIFHEISDVEEAIRQTDMNLRDAASRASLLICEEIRPMYEVKIKALVAAAIAMHEANRDYTRMADELSAKRISWAVLNPLFARFAGEPRDPCAPLRYFLREAVQEGWATPDELPPDIRGDFPKHRRA